MLFVTATFGSNFTPPNGQHSSQQNNKLFFRSDFRPHTFPVAPGRYVYLFSHKKTVKFWSLLQQKRNRTGTKPKKRCQNQSEFRKLSDSDILYPTSGHWRITRGEQTIVDIILVFQYYILTLQRPSIFVRNWHLLQQKCSVMGYQRLCSVFLVRYQQPMIWVSYQKSMHYV